MRINIKFLQTDGVPLTNDLMDTLQEAFQIFSVIGDMAGNLTILSGCEITGSTVAPGVVAIDGDVLAHESDRAAAADSSVNRAASNQRSAAARRGGVWIERGVNGLVDLRACV